MNFFRIHLGAPASSCSYLSEISRTGPNCRTFVVTYCPTCRILVTSTQVSCAQLAARLDGEALLDIPRWTLQKASEDSPYSMWAVEVNQEHSHAQP